MISCIKRRPRLFTFIVFSSIIFASVIAMIRPQNYTSYAEVVVDPTLPSHNADAALVAASEWLRSEEAARAVARLVTPHNAERLLDSDGRWALFERKSASGTSIPLHARTDGAELVRKLRTQITVKRDPKSYALQIGFTARDPRLAAIAADALATAAIANLRGDGLMVATLRFISAADPNVPENGPLTWIIIAAGALAGVTVGALAAVITERRFTGLTSGDEVQSNLGLYHLGSVPLLRSVLPQAASPIDAVVDSPLSGYAESFRSILVAARQAARRDAKVFLITSALPGEGKSTTVACLARAAAMAGDTVVVVDCDNRRSGASAALVTDRGTPGLANLLRDEYELDDVLVQDARSGAWIIPVANDGADLSLLVGGEALAGLLKTLRSRFDRVLVDSPPILAMATTRSILPLVDAAIMVIRWRATSTRAVKTAIATVPADFTAWSGVILTQVDIREQARYGLSDASAFYQQSSKYYRP